VTAGERLVALAGSGQAGVLLLSIGSGATAGAALVDYSGLTSATAAVHLMTDVATETEGPPPITYWDSMLVGSHTPTKKKQKKQELEILLLLLG
jgi:hypothetical protein